MRPDRDRRTRWTSVLGLLLATEAAHGQESPATVTTVCPPGQAPQRQGGPIRRALRHVSHAIHDDFIGDPEAFAEPPLGAYVRMNNAVMMSKAAPHRFTLYRSDFLVDSTALTPIGATRLNRMAQGLCGWLGPIVVEPTPDRPGLAEARRDAILTSLVGVGLPIGPERILVGPPVGRGLLGTDAANNYQTLISRDQLAPNSYSLTPANAAGAGGLGGGAR